jgi:integrase
MARQWIERRNPENLIGRREPWERILTDAEARAAWRGTDGLGFPYGPLIRMLILTGRRAREIADMTWTEVHFGKALLTGPARRMTNNRTHELVLARDAKAPLPSLPRLDGGDHVFSATSGLKAVNGFSKAKQRTDRLSGVSNWKYRDLRGSVRTHLSALPVQDNVRELVNAHAQKGPHKVHDRHSYRDETRAWLMPREK